MIAARRVVLAASRRGGARWLERPTRVARPGRRPARITLIVVAALVGAAAIAAASGPAPLLDDGLAGAIVDGVRHGDAFEAAAQESLRAGALAPGIVAVPLPTTAIVLGIVSAWAAIMLLGLFSIAALIAWHRRLRPAFARVEGFTVALALVTAGMPILLGPDAADLPEAWAGLLIALSLARRTPARLLDPIAWGVAAMALSPATLIVGAVMSLCAAAERRGREALGWLAASAVGLAMLLLHARLVAALDGSPDAVAAAGPVGLGAAMRALADATAAHWLPSVCAGPLLVLAVLGWAGWRDPLSLRVLVSLAATLLLVAATGHAAYALLLAPVWLIGLAALPDLLRDLAAAALDRRRITVTRLTR